VLEALGERPAVEADDEPDDPIARRSDDPLLPNPTFGSPSSTARSETMPSQETAPSEIVTVGDNEDGRR
jgi:hypothetical protein